MRPSRRGRPHRRAARHTRMWADGEGLHLVTPDRYHRWPVGPEGIRSVRFVHTAAYDLDHGVDPLLLDPFGHLEVPAHGDTPQTNVELAHWISDRDLVSALEVADPLKVSGAKAVLDEVGLRVEVARKRTRAQSQEGRRNRPRLLLPGEGRKLAGILIAAALGMAVYVSVPGAVLCGAAAVAICGTILLMIRIPVLRALWNEHRSRWPPARELRPTPRPGLRRGFVRNARLASVGSELVVVDGAGGELWLGRESITGVAAAVRIDGAGGPVRVELRRADGTSLARLPWDDWFAVDEGEALSRFCVAIELPLEKEDWQPSRRDEIAVLGPPIYVFSSRGVGSAQDLELADSSVGLEPGRVPAAVTGVPCLVTLVAANEGGAGVLVAVGAAVVMLAAAGPALVDMALRWWQLRELR